MRNRFKPVMLAVVTTSAVGLAACGGGASGTQPTGAAGVPIKVMTIAPINIPVGGGLPFPEFGVAAKAAADAINRAGGINGRPIQLTVCDNKFNQNQDAACARQAVDEGDVALIGGISIQTNHISIIEQAGIPAIGEYPADTASFNSPVVFPFTGGNNTYGCLAELADVAKAKRVAVVSLNNAVMADPKLKANLQAMLARRGSQLDSYVLYTPAPDLTFYVANALKDNPDAIYLAGSTPDVDKLTQLVRQFNGKIAIARTSVPPSSLQNLGPMAENVYVCDPFKPASLTHDPNVRRFVDQMKQSQTPLDTYASDAWAAMYVFAQVAGGLNSVTRASILSALAKAKVDTLLGPSLDFTKTVHPELGFRHIYNFSWLYNQVRHGAVVNLNNGRFVDPLA
jgi:branched-chain amino acid transport system substrate-binding protein